MTSPDTPPSWHDLRERIDDDLQALEDLTLHPDDLTRLADLSERLHDLRQLRQYQHTVEASAPYPPDVAGGWFRTVAESGASRSSSTLHGVLALARQEATASGREVMVEQWSPDANQDEANAGWSMIQVVRP